MTVNVLGTDYTIERRNEKEDPKLASGMDAYCDTSVKRIVVSSPECEDVTRKEDLEYYAKECTRHEIVHAFLFESGLDGNTGQLNAGWATNEEMIDWIAIQSPKLFKAFEQAGCM